jgi:hypothetical protein
MMIKDMPTNTTAKLTADVKKQLAEIIEQEFTNKESLFHAIQQREKEKVMTKYRFDVSFSALRAKLTKAQDRIAIAERDKAVVLTAIEDLGLNEDGEQGAMTRYVNGKNISIEGAKKLEKLLEVIDRNAPSQNLKSKLISRLMLATTVGEATVIMREVLGNGIITDVKAITFQETR